MKKFINETGNIAKELTLGLVKANSDMLKLVDEDIIIRNNPKEEGKVPIVFAQGLGHEPGYNGYVGYEMHDVEICGNIFSCAGGNRIYKGIKIAWESSGATLK